MAEAIGIAAAMLQFGKVVLELKCLCSSIKNAPQSLEQLLEELVSLEEILRTLADQETLLSLHTPLNVVRTCRVQCEIAVKSLSLSAISS